MDEPERGVAHQVVGRRGTRRDRGPGGGPVKPSAEVGPSPATIRSPADMAAAIQSVSEPTTSGARPDTSPPARRAAAVDPVESIENEIGPRLETSTTACADSLSLIPRSCPSSSPPSPRPEPLPNWFWSRCLGTSPEPVRWRWRGATAWWMHVVAAPDKFRAPPMPRRWRRRSPGPSNSSATRAIRCRWPTGARARSTCWADRTASPPSPAPWVSRWRPAGGWTGASA